MPYNKYNELLIPANGNCLYTSVIIGYLLPVLGDFQQFYERLSRVSGIANIEKSKVKIFQEKFIRRFRDVKFLRTPVFRDLVEKFKQTIGVNDQLWGGTEEIKIISRYLKVNIQELIRNPEDERFYIKSDKISEFDGDPSQFETLFILRTTPEPDEAVQSYADAPMQIAQMENALLCRHEQHYRLFLTDPLLIQTHTLPIEASENKEDMADCKNDSSVIPLKVAPEEENAYDVRLFTAWRTAYRLFMFFQNPFNSLVVQKPSSQAIKTVLSDTHESGSLLSKAHAFAEKIPLFNSPDHKKSEDNSLWVLATRILMLLYPKCFEALNSDEPISVSICYQVFKNIFKKIIENSGLNAYHDTLIKEIKEKIEQDQDKKLQYEATLDFMEGCVRFLKYLGADTFNDPKQDPLNAYVNVEWIQELRSIREGLKENRMHPDYSAQQNRANELDELIKINRLRKMQEIGETTAALLKRMRPELADLNGLEDLNAHFEIERENSNREEFEAYLLTEFEETDIFESNQLRSFEDKLQRYQYGKIYYKIVCESFQPAFKDSLVHQIAKRVYIISQLDAIHESPKEARSRMPITSTDGHHTSNFGYNMPRSEAYQRWITNPLVRACGDLIVDAYHYAVDFGRTLKINSFFLKYFRIIFEGFINRTLDADWVDSYSVHYNFAIFFARYLLESTFNTPFDWEQNVFDQLNRVTTKKELISKAKEALHALKEFSKEKFKLRPSSEPSSENGDQLGLVFGIGFNGELFSSPSRSGAHHNEIWLNFSDSGRNNGGRLLLGFIAYIAQQGALRLLDIEISSPEELEHYFDKYKILIQMNLKSNLDLYQDIPSMTPLREQYELFLKECEDEKVAFDSLTQEFKNWLCNPKNLWYSIPSNSDITKKIVIKIPPDMKEYEHTVQIFTRELLLDVLTERLFLGIEAYSHLIPDLFKHWRQEIINELYRENLVTMAEKVRITDKLQDLSFNEGLIVGSILNQLIIRVHPELQTIWNPAIAQKLIVFKQEILNSLTVEMQRKEGEIKGMKKQAKGMKIIRPDIMLISHKKLKQAYKVKKPTYILSDQGFFYIDSNNHNLNVPLCRDQNILAALKKMFDIEASMDVPDRFPPPLDSSQQNYITQITGHSVLKVLEPEMRELDCKIQTAEKEKITLKSKIKKLEENIQALEIELDSYKQGNQVVWRSLQEQLSTLFQSDYEKFKSDFFKKRKQGSDVSPEKDVSQCVEPLFARVLGHDRFFSVHISKQTGATPIRDGSAEGSLPLQLGRLIPQDVIPPCNKRCQYHVLGHVFMGDMLGPQSADLLDARRRTHGLQEAPVRFSASFDAHSLECAAEEWSSPRGSAVNFWSDEENDDSDSKQDVNFQNINGEMRTRTGATSLPLRVVVPFEAAAASTHAVEANRANTSFIRSTWSPGFNYGATPRVAYPIPDPGIFDSSFDSDHEEDKETQVNNGLGLENRDSDKEESETGDDQTVTGIKALKL